VDSSRESYGYFCKICFEGIVPISSPRCPKCSLPFEEKSGPDHKCSQCIKEPPLFLKAISLFVFGGPLKEAIYHFKYKPCIEIGYLLAKLFLYFLPPDLERYDLVIPVPLSRSKLRKRGFNQSLILARALAQSLSIPIDYLSLLKVHETVPQTKLGLKQRQKNLYQAFRVPNKRLTQIKNKKILLLDDIYTTGATIKECTKTLLKNQAQSITALTLARGI
jgi:ComF family protein